ncbi:hypothetical protein IG631_21209 [Alternaria alternata]|nr:hypothetical protein IG631_21209 [Alternaria alternata]
MSLREDWNKKSIKFSCISSEATGLSRQALSVDEEHGAVFSLGRQPTTEANPFHGDSLQERVLHPAGLDTPRPWSRVVDNDAAESIPPGSEPIAFSTNDGQFFSSRFLNSIKQTRFKPGPIFNVPFGPQEGTLVSFGGLTFPTATDNEPGAGWGNVWIYDKRKKVSYHQPTAGDVPELGTDPDAFAFWSETDEKNGTFEIWTKTNFKNYPRRVSMKCNSAGNNQAICVGGHNPELSVPWNATDEWLQGIGVIDMTNLVLTDSYNASAPPYIAPKSVRTIYANSVDEDRHLFPTVYALQEVKSIFENFNRATPWLNQSIDDRRLTYTSKPIQPSNEPPNFTNEPPAPTDKPPIPTHELSATTNELPATTGELPATTGKLPPHVNKPPTRTNELPTPTAPPSSQALAKLPVHMYEKNNQICVRGTPPKHEPSTNIYIIVIAVVIPTVSLLSCAGGYWCWRKRHRGMSTLEEYPEDIGVEDSDKEPTPPRGCFSGHFQNNNTGSGMQVGHGSKFQNFYQNTVINNHYR